MSLHLVFTNDWGRPLCSVWISRHTGDGAHELVQTEGGTGPKGRVPMPPGAQLTFDITNGTYDFSSYSCDQYTSGLVQRVEVTGPMAISIGGKPHGAPAGYTVGVLPMSGNVGTSDTNIGPTCSPDYANEVDPTKCCSGKIDTKDMGSHYFCTPAR